MSAERLTGDDSIKTWLAHPTGGPVLRELLAQGGQSADALRPVGRLAIKRLVGLSKGAFSQEALDAVIARANATSTEHADGASSDGPEAGAGAETPAAAVVEQQPWVERVSQGRFADRTVVVTGAGSGIGRATASRILREGGRVVAVDVSQERLDALAAEHDGADVVTLVADITDPARVDDIVAAAGGRIDGLANVAGIMDDMSPIGEVSDATWQRVMRVNVDGTMLLTRAVVPTMLAQGSGSIVNVASEAALRGSAAGVAYTASKHAVVGITKSTAFMYAGRGIRCNAVAPGPVITNIEASFASELGAERVQLAMTVLPDAAEAEQLAASITFLLSDDGVNVTGVVLPSDGGWSAT
ncbi:SDR family NAD(P)-dependent oxidoreductase [Agrococcus jejuensis]|uniref:SDR family NAD(P)-dependent oxidoreductase n=1 Tax=Agrococcus jejuensis TaxID=399736 RepID=UPI0011A39773|nr:SDR family NAD(P)-dependent oxidoreductase [Agrococcus jejuensis]